MKVDEQFKCKDCDNYNQCKYYHNRRETSFICKEFQNQWGYIEELEKIKAEIGKEFVDLQDGSEEWRSYVNESVLSCYEIVENRIHELKGDL